MSALASHIAKRLAESEAPSPTKVRIRARTRKPKATALRVRQAKRGEIARILKGRVDPNRTLQFTPYGVAPGEKKQIGTSTKPFRRSYRKEIVTLGSDLGSYRAKSLQSTI